MTNTTPTANTAAQYKRWGRPLSLHTQALRYPVVLLLCVLVLAVALNITTDRMPDPASERPLPDMGQELLPKVLSLEHGTDALLAVMNISIIFLVWKLYLLHRHTMGQDDLSTKVPHIPFLTNFFFGLWKGHEDAEQDPYSRINCHYVAWIRFWVTYSILSLFRAPVIMLTSLPATDNHCQADPKVLDPLENIVLTVVTLGSGSIHCGDLMYSGHSVSATLAFISLWTYGGMIWWILRPLGFTLMSLTWITILASRSHYTDDIVVAIYLTIATYWLIPHDALDGAPLSLQTVIRWWPCCGSAELRDVDAVEGGSDAAAVEDSNQPRQSSVDVQQETPA